MNAYASDFNITIEPWLIFDFNAITDLLAPPPSPPLLDFLVNFSKQLFSDFQA